MQHDQRQAQPGIEVAVLVSIGRHPITGRARRAEQDARGLELALAMAADRPGTRIDVLHAGPQHGESEAALRGYLGMATGDEGVQAMTLLEQPEGSDAIPALVEHRRRLRLSWSLPVLEPNEAKGRGCCPMPWPNSWAGHW